MKAEVERAAELAGGLLRHTGSRVAHVREVANSARMLADSLGLDSEVLVSAAWLHDIGYSREVRETGFHPLDGARHLRSLGWDERIVCLVAHHSCARFEAALRGLDAEHAEFVRPSTAYEDALCYCDMTNGPTGDPVIAPDRLDEIQERYGEGHIVTRFVEAARPEILASVERVEQRLRLSESRASGR